MRKWDELPKFMRTDEVKQYYDILIRHEKELRLKRYSAFDDFTYHFITDHVSHQYCNQAGFTGTGDLQAGACDTVWKEIPYSKIPYYGAECRQDGNTGYDQSGFQTDTGWKSDPWLQD